MTRLPHHLRHVRSLLGLRDLRLPAAGLVALLLLSGCAPDVTRQRLESDVATTYVAASRLRADLQGVPAPTPTVTRTVCHSQTNTQDDAGPGPWTCTLSYTLADRPLTVTLGVTVDSLGCYAAVDGEHRDNTVLDAATGVRVGDPTVGFDGCFDVYDDQTGTENGPNGSTP